MTMGGAISVGPVVADAPPVALFVSSGKTG